MDKLDKLEDLVYVEKGDTILLGMLVGSATADGGKQVDLIASGNLVRVNVKGVEGHVDIKLDRFVENAVEWLLAKDRP